MQLPFINMRGAGNRILVVDTRRAERAPPSAKRLRELGAGSSGPGFDQLMWVTSPLDERFVASYRVFNADGSEVQQCGNGVRCVARVLARELPGRADLTLGGPVGPVAARLLDGGRVAVDMGAPIFAPADIPFVADEVADRYTIDVSGQALDAAVLSMGNPHCVLEVDDVASADVAGIGAALQQHERFPERVNVGFLTILGRQHIALRVFERGVGETLACGTGACAAMVAAHIVGRVDDDVTVSLPGGQLVVSWPGAGEAAWLAGDAETISEGTIDL